MNRLIILYFAITVVQLTSTHFTYVIDHCRDPNAEYVKKVDPCPMTCDRSKPCPKIYHQISLPGCQCLPGYVKKDSTWRAKCIKPELCPIPFCLGAYEQYKHCMNQDPRSCSNASLPTSLDYDFGMDDTNCPPGHSGCECVPKYVRDKNNCCVSIHTCPAPSCPHNELWNWCPAYCTFDQDCGSYLYGYIKDCPAPPPSYELMCHNPRCQCLPGYLRLENGSCQLPESCCSVGNTTVVDCPAGCDKTCSGEPYSNCEMFCRLRKCMCKPGHVRDTTGNCILLEDCYVSSGSSNLPGPPEPSHSVLPPTQAPSPAIPSHLPPVQPSLPSSQPPSNLSSTPSSCTYSTPTETSFEYLATHSRPNHAHTPIGPPDPRQFTTVTKLTVPTSNQTTNPPSKPTSKPTINPSSKPTSNPTSNSSSNTTSEPTSKPPTTTSPPTENYESDEGMGCQGDPNAVSKPCGDPCPLSCDNFENVKPQPCPEICIVNGCTCKPGFVLNEYGKCVFPEECS